MAYNMTWTGEANTLLDVFTNINDLTAGILIMLVLAGIGFFVYSRTIERGTTTAFLSASFVMSIIGTLFLYASLLEWYILTICILLFLVSLIVRFFEG